MVKRKSLRKKSRKQSYKKRSYKKKLRKRSSKKKKSKRLSKTRRYRRKKNQKGGGLDVHSTNPINSTFSFEDENAISGVVVKTDNFLKYPNQADGVFEEIAHRYVAEEVTDSRKTIKPH